MSYSGIVKWFKKSYGFITTEDDVPQLNGKNEIFVHFSGIKAEGFKKLEKDQEVTFDVVVGANGPQATNVEVINSNR